MNEYSEACVMTFLREQSRLFDEPVAENYEEAEAFLEGFHGGRLWIL